MTTALLFAAGLVLGSSGLSGADEGLHLCEGAGQQQISCTLCPQTSNLQEIYVRTRKEWRIRFDVGADGKPDFNSVEFLDAPRGTNSARLKAMTRIAFVGSTFPTDGEAIKDVQCEMKLAR